FMYDVIVVGAGPAGSTAASFLAREGLRALLVDRESFPREKACGDAVPARSFAIMNEMGLAGPFDPDKFFPIDQFVLKGQKGTVAEFDFTPEQGKGTCVVTRYDFDQLLSQHAIASGAEFCQLNVSGPILENGQIQGIRAKSGKEEIEYRSKIVI